MISRGAREWAGSDEGGSVATGDLIGPLLISALVAVGGNGLRLSSGETGALAPS